MLPPHTIWVSPIAPEGYPGCLLDMPSRVGHGTDRLEGGLRSTSVLGCLGNRDLVKAVVAGGGVADVPNDAAAVTVRVRPRRWFQTIGDVWRLVKCKLEKHGGRK
jgi:hypothetical protein